MISKDPRLSAFGLLLLPASVGHALQLLGEDRPWSADAWARYWVQPGWHLYLSPWVPAAIAVLLGLSVVGLAARRTRPWLAAFVLFYALHYLTYPYRIRNHMSHSFFGLTMLGAVWLAGIATRGIDLRGEGPRARVVDGAIVNGLALVLCTTYFFAGLHKINASFLSIGPLSTAAAAITGFWIYTDLGSVPPDWVKWTAAYGSVLIECAVPLVAWRVSALRVPAILTLMLFHYPMVSTMNVSDYPMIVSASYPCLFTLPHFLRVLRHAGPSPATIGGALLGAAMQAWAVSFWGELTIFGVFVLALWGWAAGAMLREQRAAFSAGARARAPQALPQ